MIHLRQGGPFNPTYHPPRLRGDRFENLQRFQSWALGWAGSTTWIRDLPIWCRPDDSRPMHGPRWDNTARYGIAASVEPDRSLPGEETYAHAVEMRRRHPHRAPEMVYQMGSR